MALHPIATITRGTNDLTTNPRGVIRGKGSLTNNFALNNLLTSVSKLVL